MRVKTKGKTTDSLRQYNREYQHERREKYKQSGLCVQCGNKALKARTLCASCADKQRLAQDRYRKVSIAIH